MRCIHGECKVPVHLSEVGYRLGWNIECLNVRQ